MAATNKTSKYNLPQWVASDKPERTDFNTAMSDIDTNLNLVQDLATKAKNYKGYFATGEIIPIVRSILADGYTHGSLYLAPEVIDKPAFFDSNNMFLDFWSYGGTNAVSLRAYNFLVTGTRIYFGIITASDVLIWRYSALQSE